MPSIAEGSSSAGSGDAGGSARAAGSGVGTAAGGAAWILGCGAPNIIVDRGTFPGLAAGFEPGAGTGGSTDFAGDSPNIMVPPAAGAAVGLEGTGAFFAGAGCEGRFAVGNIMVRPAASSDVGGTDAAGDRGGLPAAAGCGGCFAGGGMLFERGGAAKIAVAFGWGSFVGAGGTGFCGGSAAAAPGGITLKTFWHFPQRMLRPCGPIRASSTR